MDWKLDISSLTKVFHKVEDGSTFVALRDIELQVRAGEFLLIVGPSGCGKTTLLRLIASLERPTTGEIRLDGRKVSGPGRDRGMVFQEHLLFPWLTVKGNVGFGLRGKGLPKDGRERLVADNLKLVGLESFANNYSKELSGGMKQRVGIARALAADPELLLMDEPFGSVDAQTRHGLQTELLNIWYRTGKTIIFVTHSVEEAVFLADRIVLFQSNPGRIAQVISVDLPRPRERTSPEFNRLESQVLKYLSDGATQGQLQPRQPRDLRNGRVQGPLCRWRMEEYNRWLYAGFNDATTLLRYTARRRLGPSAARWVDQHGGVEHAVEAEGGFDLWRTRDGIHWTCVTRTGFDNPHNNGVRTLKSTPVALLWGP